MNRAGIVNLIKEPLLHFLLIGAALFLLYGWRGSPASVPGGQAGTRPAQIVITQDALDQMNNLGWGTRPFFRCQGKTLL